MDGYELGQEPAELVLLEFQESGVLCRKGTVFA